MGQLDQADELTTFSFKQMQVKVRRRRLSRRRQVKVALDGEVSYMDNPLEFRVMEEQLLLLKPDETWARDAEATQDEPPALVNIR